MLRELFDLNRSYIEHFFENVDIAAADHIFTIMKECKGSLCFSGVGKSALVAKKIAVTMVSTGTRASYVSATDALHGDLGIVTDQDVFTFFSKSGESDELLSLAPYIRNKGAQLIAIVSHADSRLAKACHHSIVLPVKQELCPFNLAPTTSTAIQMIFGDVLTVALMREKRFTLDAYALNHPAGRIGKRISLRVRDLMLTGPRLPLCKPDDQIINVLGELSSKGRGCILVVDDNGFLLGIFTDGDLRRSLQKYGVTALEKPLSELMTTTPRCIDDHELAWDAMKVMESNQKSAISLMPVVDKDKKVLGLIHMHDILQSGL
ncbi:MAG: KpsF/GutQ family sugar-phosphate isomerase [Nitrosomonas sp.]|nr:MAG: KpsF/GutQ family sugar-phosphate isomerase [Nitrosomonas sp.]